MEKKQKVLPVLMIPLRRCGSHAIRLRLNFNADFYSPYPLHLVDFMPLIPLYGDLSVDQNYFRMIVDLIGLQAISMVKWEGVVIDPIEFFNSIQALPRSVHTVAWEILLFAARQHGAKVVMDKSLDNIHYWKELLPLYPDMKFLNLVRDPRAQVSSMNKAVIHEFDSMLNAQILVKAHLAASALIQAHPDKVLTIRFEDFIEDEAVALKKICHFFEIEFLPEMLEISKSNEAKKISTQSSLWESNHFPPLKANVDKFKNSLSMDEIEVIESLCKDVMQNYNYVPMTAQSKIINTEQVEVAMKASAEKRKQYWLNMKATKPFDFYLRMRRAQYLEMCKKALES